MSTDISGWVEINTVRESEEHLWFPVICIDVLANQNYAAFGRLFGVRAKEGVRPIAPARGYPPNMPRWRIDQLDLEGRHGITWANYEELAEPLEELCRAEHMEGWSFILNSMSQLSQRFGETNVRLVVGFAGPRAGDDGIRFDFSITQFPNRDDSYHVAASTEGTLNVFIADRLFMHADGILLVEFANALAGWIEELSGGGRANLYYSSMDFEEEPILALEFAEDEVLTARSVWARSEAAQVSLSEAQRASRAYLENLHRALENHRPSRRPISDAAEDPRVPQLQSAVSATRALTAHMMADDYVGEAMEPLHELLNDRAPFVFHHAGKPMVAEVRAAALNALQLMYKQINLPPDFGVVEVRKAMTADEIRKALDAADAHEVARATNQAEEFLAERVIPANEEEGKLLLSYRILQQLGKIEYRLEQVDPDTYMTPLQAEVSASQLTSERPRPHVRFSSLNDQRLLGYYYPENDRWILDFAEDAGARDVERYLRSILTIEKNGVPRVVPRADGTPKTNPDGSFVLDGVAPFDGDPREVLFSVSAFLATKANADVVC